MRTSLGTHILFYGCLLVWGLVDLVRSVAGDASLVTALLGAIYLAVAGYRLCSGPGPESLVPAVQRVP